MPDNKYLRRIERVALTSLYNKQFTPLHSEGLTFVIACINEIATNKIVSDHPGRFDTAHPLWTKNKYRVSCSNFGNPGDVLLWLPQNGMPERFAGIRVQRDQVVISSPLFTFSDTGRLLLSVHAFCRRPDIVLRFEK